LDKLNDEQRIEAWKACWEKSLVGMAIVKEDGTFYAVNDQWVKMLGEPASAFYGNSWQDITPAEEIRQDEEQARLVARGMIDSYEIDKSFIFKGGRRKFIRLLVTRIPMDTDKPFLFFLSRIVLRRPTPAKDLSKSSMSGQQASKGLRKAFPKIIEFLVRYWLPLAMASATIFGIINEVLHLGFL
jgi:PAS domain S-box-containing protein